MQYMYLQRVLVSQLRSVIDCNVSIAAAHLYQTMVRWFSLVCPAHCDWMVDLSFTIMVAYCTVALDDCVMSIGMLTFGTHNLHVQTFYYVMQ